MYALKTQKYKTNETETLYLLENELREKLRELRKCNILYLKNNQFAVQGDYVDKSIPLCLTNFESNELKKFYFRLNFKNVETEQLMFWGYKVYYKDQELNMKKDIEKQIEVINQHTEVCTDCEEVVEMDLRELSEILNVGYYEYEPTMITDVNNEITLRIYNVDLGKDVMYVNLMGTELTDKDYTIIDMSLAEALRVQKYINHWYIREVD